MIRPYRDSDFSDVAWLNQQAYLTPCTENELRARIGSGRCWVWEDSPLVIGCLITCSQDDKIIVWSVTVAENWRRRGVATKLLEAAAREYPELWLHTEPNSPGNHLYTKLGYTASKVEYDYYGPGQDAVLMVKR